MITSDAPLENFVADGSVLAEWLGSFWLRIYEDPELAKNTQLGQGVLSGQLYLNFVESLDLLDRNEVPVFHRERWNPVVLRLSTANMGQASLLRMDMDPTPVIGPQTGSGFTQGTIFPIGGHAEYENAVSYPMAPTTESVLTCITDNIMKPTVSLVRGTDFVVRENTIFFLRSNDPFTSGAFPTRTIVNADGTTDEEVLLWACDTLFDKDYVFNYLGYVLNVLTPSTEFYKRMLNGLWDLYNMGTPISWLQSGIGALLGEPTVVHPIEVVDTILYNEDNIQIITDLEVYTVAVTATLRASVYEGATLAGGEFFTETIRMYETLDPLKLDACSEFGERLRTDVPSMFFNAGLFKSDLKFGIGANWEVSDIVNTGTDANGNPKLKFTIYGNEDDVDLFWTDFWTYLEENNMSSETCFSEYLDDIVVPIEGAVYGRVAPLEYFLRYFVKYNAFVVVLERTKLSNPPDDRDPVTLLKLLRQVTPAHTMMIVVEQRQTEEEYDLDDLESAIGQTWAQPLTDSATYGGPSRLEMTYKDSKPVMRFVPVCD